jgi:hypothetical protein
LRTLVVGSAAREVKAYGANEFVHHYFHLSESKDYSRVIEPFLSGVVQSLRKRVGKKKNQPGLTQSPLYKRYHDAKGVLADYRDSQKLPDNLHLDCDASYERLLFEDSHYNFTSRDYGDIFRRTGANVAYGYGLMPLEMLFPEMPESRLYSYAKSTGSTN